MIVWIGLIIYVIYVYLLSNIINWKNKKMVFLILASIGTIFIMGSRSTNYPLINDVKVYNDFFVSAKTLPWSSVIHNSYYNFEKGYVVFNKVLATIISHPQALNYAIAIICVTCFSIFVYKNSDEPLDSFIFFIAFGLLRFSLSGYRQAIAMSICLLSYEFIKKRKFIPFCIIVLVASCFHFSAVIFLFSYWLFNREINAKQIIVTIIAIICIFGAINTIMYVANNVFNRQYMGSATENRGYAYIILHLCIILLYFWYNRDNQNIKMEFNITIISFVLFILSFFVDSIIQRICWYFFYGLAIAISNMYPKNNERVKTMYRILFFYMAFILTYHRFSGDIYGNYTFFWN